MSHSTLSIPVSQDRVLLAVEDDVSADLLVHRMTRRGIHPERAEHGQAAIDQMQEIPFDLVIIENRLPGLTGLELLQRLPSDDVMGSPNVILLGEAGNNENIIRAFELGAAEYIERPFAPEVALARIVRFLGDGPQLVSRPSTGGLLLLPGMPLGSAFGGPFLFDLMIGVTVVLVVLATLLAITATLTHLRAKSQNERREELRSRWKNTLLDVLAGDQTPQDLIDQVPRSQERFFLEFLVPYAATFEGRAQDLLVALARPFLVRLADDLKRRNPGRRARAVQLFGLLGDASCHGLLRERLRDRSFLVAYTAFRWLARGGASEDAPYLLNVLDRFSDVSVKQLSSALVHLDVEAAPVFRSYLQDENQSTFVRVVCAETLRWMGDGAAAPIAAQLLAYEPHPELVAALLRLLRRVGQPEHAPLVRSYCTADVPFVRIHAARALGQIGHPEDDQRLLRNLMLDTSSRWAALNAARSLKELDQTTPLHHLSRTNHQHAALAESVLKEPAS